MEWIFIGIAIAIGFYLAPIIITFFLAILMVIFSIIRIIFEKFIGRG